MLGESLTLNGRRWKVFQAGDPASPALLLLHGFTGRGESWHEFAQKLPQWRIIAPDLPGHGETEAPVGSLTNVAQDLVALLDHLGVGQVLVAGYSMGGRLALHLALQAPERLRGVIVVGATPGILDPEDRAARRASDEKLAQRIEVDLEAFVLDWEEQPLFWTQRSLAPETREQIRAIRRSHAPKALAAALRRMGTGAQDPLHDKLKTLAVPVLWVAGEYDAKFRAIAQSIQTLLPDVRVAVVPYAGHAVHIERPSAFRTLLTSFAEAHPLRPTDQHTDTSPLLTPKQGD